MQPAGAFVDSVFHGLAFVPASTGASAAARAASLHWPAYVVRARADMPLGAWEPLEIDAWLLSKLFEPVEVAHAIGLFAELHESIPAFQRTARASLWELTEGDVASRAALRALRALPEQAVELFRAGLLLCAREFAQLHHDQLEPFSSQASIAIAACAAKLEPALRSLELARVRLSATLGPRGRGFESGIVVGVASPPGASEQLEPEPTLVMALHERLVERAAARFVARGWEPAWSRVESVAIAAERLLTRGTMLEAAQVRWLDALDSTGLAPMDADLELLLGEVVRGATGERPG